MLNALLKERTHSRSKNSRVVHSSGFRFFELFSTSLKWHFGQMNVSVSRENLEDFRVFTAIGHASHAGQATRVASGESDWPIEITFLHPDLRVGSLNPFP
jgi:hypothetical protein